MAKVSATGALVNGGRRVAAASLVPLVPRVCLASSAAAHGEESSGRKRLESLYYPRVEASPPGDPGAKSNATAETIANAAPVTKATGAPR